jgi:hypothetical protein
MSGSTSISTFDLECEKIPTWSVAYLTFPISGALKSGTQNVSITNSPQKPRSALATVLSLVKASQQAAINQLDEISKLPADWDGYHAAPLNDEIVDTARLFLRELPVELAAIPPHVVPMTLGRVQLEWHDGPRSLELEFESPSRVHYLKWDHSLKLAEEDHIPLSDSPRIHSLIKWFLSSTGDA